MVMIETRDIDAPAVKGEVWWKSVLRQVNDRDVYVCNDYARQGMCPVMGAINQVDREEWRTQYPDVRVVHVSRQHSSGVTVSAYWGNIRVWEKCVIGRQKYDASATNKMGQKGAYTYPVDKDELAETITEAESFIRVYFPPVTYEIDPRHIYVTEDPAQKGHYILLRRHVVSDRPADFEGIWNKPIIYAFHRLRDEYPMFIYSRKPFGDGHWYDPRTGAEIDTYWNNPHPDNRGPVINTLNEFLKRLSDWSSVTFDCETVFTGEE